MSTYDQYRAMLRVNKHSLDDELEIQAQIMEDISTETTRRNARMMEAKQELDRVEARLTMDFRESEEKLTAQEITAKIKRDKGRTTAWQAYLDALTEHSKWAGLLEAWRQKGYSIKTLADLYSSQYFQMSSHQVTHRAARDSFNSEDARASLRSAVVASDDRHKATDEVVPRRTRRGITDGN